MAIELISKIVPKSNGTFPMLEDVHLQGGYQIRVDILDRDSIPTLSRKVGMLAHLTSTGETFRLSGGVLNSNWVLESTSVPIAGSGISVTGSTVSVNLGVLSGLSVSGGTLQINLGANFAADAITGALLLAQNSIAPQSLAFSSESFDVLTSSGVFSVGLTSFTTTVAPNLDPILNKGSMLLVNGVDSQVKVLTSPVNPGEWQLTSTGFLVFGDITGTSDKLRLRYFS